MKPYVLLHHIFLVDCWLPPLFYMICKDLYELPNKYQYHLIGPRYWIHTLNNLLENEVKINSYVIKVIN